MSIAGKLASLFRPLDTSEAEEAIAAAARSQRDVAVRARALRMDVCCGDPTEAIERLSLDLRTRVAFALHLVFGPITSEPLPADMSELLSKLD